MKKIVFIVLTLVTVCSCYDDIMVLPATNPETGYIKLVDDTFVVTLDKEAITNGNISVQEYESLEKEAIMANEMLQKIISDFKKDPSIKRIYIGNEGENLYYDVYEGKSTRTLEFDSDSLNNIFSPSIKSRSENPDTFPRGWLETSDSSYSSSQQWAPNGMKRIDSYCQAKVALYATHFVSTRALGNAIVNTRQGNGSLSVLLDASNTYFTISYATTDSNGGRCSWNGSR